MRRLVFDTAALRQIRTRPTNEKGGALRPRYKCSISREDREGGEEKNFSPSVFFAFFARRPNDGEEFGMHR
jgi:hypothetical protein